MATKELPMNADLDGIPQSFSKNFDQVDTLPVIFSMSRCRPRLRQMAKLKHKLGHPTGRFRQRCSTR